MSLWLTESPPSPITFVMTIGSVCNSQSIHNDFFIGWPIHSCIEDGLLLKSCSPSASSVFGENPWEICLGCCSNGGWGSHPCSKALLFFFFSFSLGPHFTIVCVHHHHHHHRDNCFDLSLALLGWLHLYKVEPLIPSAAHCFQFSLGADMKWMVNIISNEMDGKTSYQMKWTKWNGW